MDDLGRFETDSFAKQIRQPLEDNLGENSRKKYESNQKSVLRQNKETQWCKTTGIES